MEKAASLLKLRTDLVLPLTMLSAYPGSETLDMPFCLYDARKSTFSQEPIFAPRRVWLLSPRSAPTLAFDNVVLAPQSIAAGAPRWVDYGVAELPVGFSQLRVRGMDGSERPHTHLVVTAQLEHVFAGCRLEDAERRLWGLARRDAGSTTLQPARLAAGIPGIYRARYTAGPAGLLPGACVRFTLPLILGLPQAGQPDAPGYLHLSDGDCAVNIVEVSPSVESHEMNDVFCRLESALAPGRGFTIDFVAERGYLAPHCRGDADRVYWYSPLPPLAAAVALTDEHPFVSLDERNSHTFEVVPGPAARVHLLLPGRRYAGEALSLHGVFTDRYRNVPPEGPAKPVALWLDHNGTRQSLGSSEEHMADGFRFGVPLPPLAPGVYRVVATLPASLEVIARSNPLQIVPVGIGDRLYWGEIHGHTEMSDGVGDYAALYRHAREVGGLDFAAAADHACYFSDNEWQRMQDITSSWNSDGRFVTLIGYEWAGKQVHRNVYTARERLELFRGMYPPTSTLDVVWRRFHGDEAVVGGVHGPLAHGVRWDAYDAAVERFVEIYSMWGANDSRENPLMREDARHSDGMSAGELLCTGAKLGFTGGGDCHDGRVGFTSDDPDGQGVVAHTIYAPLFYRCGLTAAVIPELTRPALIRALRERSTYATTGTRLLLSFAITGLPMGAVGVVPRIDCRAEIHAENQLAHVEIVKDGQIAWQLAIESLDADIQWEDPAPGTGEHWYYLHAVQQDGHQAWSSPIWATVAGRGA